MKALPTAKSGLSSPFCLRGRSPPKGQCTVSCQPREIYWHQDCWLSYLTIWNPLCQPDWEMEERSFWFLRCSRSWQTTGRNSPGAKNQSLLPARAQLSCTDLSKFLCIRMHPREIRADKTNPSHGRRFTETTNSFRRRSEPKAGSWDKGNPWRTALRSLCKHLSRSNPIQFLPLASVGPRFHDFFTKYK